MKVYYDCEFLENGHTIDLISIGLLWEDESVSYYAVNADCDWYSIVNHSWLKDNVVPYLPTKQDKHWLRLDTTHQSVKPKADIADDVQNLLQNTPSLELWGWFSAYDHVALCQLWGRMNDLPRGVPMYTNDIQQEFHRKGDPARPAPDGNMHHALDDARYHLKLHKFIMAV